MTLTKSQKTLFNAVRTGSLAQVKAQLKKTGNIDFEGDYGRTPLEEAIFHGKVSIVKALVEGGADVNRVNDNGQTPLDYAKFHKETKIATYLKSEGAEKADDLASRNRYSRFSGYDDDDHYFQNSFDRDDDDDFKSNARAPKRSAAKKTAAKGTTAKKFTTAAEGGVELPTEPVKPKFTEESLKDIFNAKNWVGKTDDMEKLWTDVPDKLQKKFDFDAAFAEAKRETLKQHAPHAPTLKKAPPQNPPPQTPPQV
ncbi:MAG: Ankyrin [Alphaproteobacteria bacterium]|jgi:hypothetical protein|nr:Ankyrin [Alphaproteobacteria bacterium]